MTNCENCYSPYMDDRKKIIFQGMEFCNINCFLNSKYCDIEELDKVKELESDYNELNEDFKKSEDDKATVQALNKTMIDKLTELLEKYDPQLETGNKELDEILLALTDIKMEGEE